MHCVLEPARRKRCAKFGVFTQIDDVRDTSCDKLGVVFRA
jgi:hypothetical protein